MKERLSATFGRRDLFRAIMTSTVVGVVAGGFETTAAEPRTSVDKRKARYQPNSKEVQEFYRVNRYPTR
jgi:hypothetical protein